MDIKVLGKKNIGFFMGQAQMDICKVLCKKDIELMKNDMAHVLVI